MAASRPESEMTIQDMLKTLCVDCNNPTSTYCPNCPTEPSICSSCYSLTHVTPNRKQHQLRPLSDKQSFTCPEHDEKLRLYCLEERMLICSVCCYGAHKGHDALPIADAASLLRSDVADSLESVREARTAAAKKLASHESKVIEFMARVERLDASIERLDVCIKEQNPSLFLLSWVEAVRLSGAELLSPKPSHLLTNDTWKVLVKWLPKPEAKPQLLFSTSVHGWSAAEFHRLCDGKGPTLVIMQAQIDDEFVEPEYFGDGGFDLPSPYVAPSVFGGYNAESWTNARNAVHANSFWFSCSSSNSTAPKKFHSTTSRCGWGYQSDGPEFGGMDVSLSHQIATICQSELYNGQRVEIRLQEVVVISWPLKKKRDDPSIERNKPHRKSLKPSF